MKIVRRRILVFLSIVSITPFVLLVRHLLDLGEQYSALVYVHSLVARLLVQAPTHSSSLNDIQADDKIIVMARTQSEDTDWVPRELSSLVSSLQKAVHALT